MICTIQTSSPLEEVLKDLSYNVNSITQAVGAAVLDSNEYYLSCVAEICSTRDSFTAQLRKLNFDVIDSSTNFVFAKHFEYTGEVLSNELRNKGILVRYFNNERIKDYVRISIGTPDQMDTVIKAISDIIGGK